MEQEGKGDVIMALAKDYQRIDENDCVELSLAPVRKLSKSNLETIDINKAIQVGGKESLE